MRRVKIFAGSSHPALAEAICERLGTQPAKCELKKFANGETSVSIGTSIRDQDVFIVQSGSPKTNDSLMELLIMINACKGGSAKSITAVLPYFPYSRQSKKKSLRGAITGRMVANLLTIAGIDHIITLDLHASQMQGFFSKPVDNLFAEPLIARWIKLHVPRWKEAVVVSKNPGGTKRVTSLADALKLNFGIVTTEKRRQNMCQSTVLEALETEVPGEEEVLPEATLDTEAAVDPLEAVEAPSVHRRRSRQNKKPSSGMAYPSFHPTSNPHPQLDSQSASSPLAQSTGTGSIPDLSPQNPSHINRVRTAPSTFQSAEYDFANEYTDERARDVITGRLRQGHIVDDDFPSPTMSAISGSVATLPGDKEDLDPMMASIASIASAPPEHALGGSCDAGASSDEENESYLDPEYEQTITLVGNVKNKTVFIMDDIIDKYGSWIAAAETVVKKGGAKKVYCMATHGLFGNDCLEQMQECECIDYIVVTNSFPIPCDAAKTNKKLVVLELSGLLSEAIRRNHYGESISQLFVHYD